MIMLYLSKRLTKNYEAVIKRSKFHFPGPAIHWSFEQSFHHAWLNYRGKTQTLIFVTTVRQYWAGDNLG